MKNLFTLYYNFKNRVNLFKTTKDGYRCVDVWGKTNCFPELEKVLLCFFFFF